MPDIQTSFSLLTHFGALIFTDAKNASAGVIEKE
jgi:hypothetical protein